jgi:flagellar biosynthesis/type III secretory pathway ATPase
MAKKMYLKQLATYRASQLTKVLNIVSSIIRYAMALLSIQINCKIRLCRLGSEAGIFA